MKPIKQVFLREVEKMRANGEKINSVWDVAIRILSRHSDSLLITLKADLSILKLISDGISTYTISGRLRIPSSDVYETAKFWGMDVLEKTLDLNPNAIYKTGMSAIAFQTVYNSFVPVEISIKDAEKVVHNLERYSGILYFLKECEKDEKDKLTRL